VVCASIKVFNRSSVSSARKGGSLTFFDLWLSSEADDDEYELSSGSSEPRLSALRDFLIDSTSSSCSIYGPTYSSD
jgi:hypothetical protein